MRDADANRVLPLLNLDRKDRRRRIDMDACLAVCDLGRPGAAMFESG